MPANILVVDEDELILQMLDKALRKSGYQTFTTTDPLQALQRLDETSFDAAILDVKLERISGLKVLERIKAHDETIQVVMLAGAEKERFETALAALRMGAHDFLMKPMRNIQDLLASVDRAVEKRRLAYNLKELAHGLEQMSNTDTLTGLSNRRHFFEWLSQEFLRTKRYLRPIGCMLIAIDHFDELRRDRGPQCARSRCFRGRPAAFPHQPRHGQAGPLWRQRVHHGPPRDREKHRAGGRRKGTPGRRKPLLRLWREETFRHRQHRRLPHENLHFRRHPDRAGPERSGESPASGRKQRSPGDGGTGLRQSPQLARNERPEKLLSGKRAPSLDQGFEQG